MLRGRKIAVVVPAYNEQTQIGRVLDTMPHFVDLILVVDDASTDGTVQVVEQRQSKGIQVNQPNQHKYNQHNNPPIELIRHPTNLGVGAAIASGYRAAAGRADCIAVMAGDGQMAPHELQAVCEPVLTGQAGYAKGNRMSHPQAGMVIPRHRFRAIRFLSAWTSVLCGQKIYDSQSGYTALSGEALAALSGVELYGHFGFPNDLLVKLAVRGIAISEVDITPVYGVGEVSKMKIHKLVFTLPILMLRLTGYTVWMRLFARHLRPAVA